MRLYLKKLIEVLSIFVFLFILETDAKADTINNGQACSKELSTTNLMQMYEDQAQLYSFFKNYYIDDETSSDVKVSIQKITRQLNLLNSEEPNLIFNLSREGLSVDDFSSAKSAILMVNQLITLHQNIELERYVDPKLKLINQRLINYYKYQNCRMLNKNPNSSPVLNLEIGPISSSVSKINTKNLTTYDPKTEQVIQCSEYDDARGCKPGYYRSNVGAGGFFPLKDPVITVLKPNFYMVEGSQARIAWSVFPLTNITCSLINQYTKVVVKKSQGEGYWLSPSIAENIYRSPDELFMIKCQYPSGQYSYAIIQFFIVKPGSPWINTATTSAEKTQLENLNKINVTSLAASLTGMSGVATNATKIGGNEFNATGVAAKTTEELKKLNYDLFFDVRRLWANGPYAKIEADKAALKTYQAAVGVPNAISANISDANGSKRLSYIHGSGGGGGRLENSKERALALCNESLQINHYDKTNYACIWGGEIIEQNGNIDPSALKRIWQSHSIPFTWDLNFGWCGYDQTMEPLKLDFPNEKALGILKKYRCNLNQKPTPPQYFSVKPASPGGGSCTPYAMRSTPNCNGSCGPCSATATHPARPSSWVYTGQGQIGGCKAGYKMVPTSAGEPMTKYICVAVETDFFKYNCGALAPESKQSYGIPDITRDEAISICNACDAASFLKYAHCVWGNEVIRSVGKVPDFIISPTSKPQTTAKANFQLFCAGGAGKSKSIYGITREEALNLCNTCEKNIVEKDVVGKFGYCLWGREILKTTGATAPVPVPVPVPAPTPTPTIEKAVFKFRCGDGHSKTRPNYTRAEAVNLCNTCDTNIGQKYVSCIWGDEVIKAVGLIP